MSPTQSFMDSFHLLILGEADKPLLGPEVRDRVQRCLTGVQV